MTVHELIARLQQVAGNPEVEIRTAKGLQDIVGIRWPASDGDCVQILALDGVKGFLCDDPAVFKQAGGR